ncbi:thioesterase family protein [Caulobacter sp. 17J80-11]|uniref:acyl-CoA thioesterase n=1 Tax=Caulobacter sp. 17J80-11 TaxID=2763502 RepID=UPI0021041AB4|nr:thioesterase family protein [Caulobacter sp. 17J80-11]
MSARDGYRQYVTIDTRWMDNDVYGHVNNVVYYSFFDTAVNRWLIEQGVLEPATSPVIGLVVETGCRFAKSLSFPDRVEAGLRVAKIGTSSVRYEVGLFRAGDPEPAAEGHFVHVYVDRETRRPTPVPADMRKVLEGLLV